ncbi:tyrosine-type recombinase/integrase [Haloferula sp.]|uniref:tyrosine-type recombinase/integrase n=1 Tax=Haloferula sp. TaxID=2497595 RepID=UPI003C76C414
MRRDELAKLALHDLNRERQTLQIRQGKDHKVRVVPVGERALTWLERYLDEVRPRLMQHTNEPALFLTSNGEAVNPDVISRMVTKYFKKAEIDRPGSCHLLRHTCATPAPRTCSKAEPTSSNSSATRSSKPRRFTPK